MKLINLIGIRIAYNFPSSSHVTEPSNEMIFCLILEIYRNIQPTNQKFVGV